jgi:Flp pilus assembly pilin Flp
LQSIRRFLRAIRSGQEGISVTEYGLLVAAVAVALLLVVSTTGTSIRDMWDRVTCIVYDSSCQSGPAAGGGGTNAGGGGGSGQAPPGGGVGSSNPGSGANGGGANNDGSNPNGTTNNGGSKNGGAGNNKP